MSENGISAVDMTGHCDYKSDRSPQTGAQGKLEDIAEWLTAVTGISYTKEKIVEAVERRRLIEWSYYLLCKKFRGEGETENFFPRPDGYWADKQDIDLDAVMEAAGIYYKMRGIDPETFIPKREALERLGLEDVADRLEAAGLIAKKGKTSPETKPKKQ
jgi:aldehyde:ferredoxin oxidoreductase